eukprot:4535566-Alexandrium_andersonii.AAC.1
MSRHSARALKNNPERGRARTWPGIACPVAVAACRSTRREKLLERGCAAIPVRSRASASWRTRALAR